MSIKPVWIQLGVRWADRRFWTDELHEWLEFNGKKKKGTIERLVFPLGEQFSFSLSGSYGRAETRWCSMGKLKIPG